MAWSLASLRSCLCPWRWPLSFALAGPHGNGRPPLRQAAIGRRCIRAHCQHGGRRTESSGGQAVVCALAEGAKAGGTEGGGPSAYIRGGRPASGSDNAGTVADPRHPHSGGAADWNEKRRVYQPDVGPSGHGTARPDRGPGEDRIRDRTPDSDERRTLSSDCRPRGMVYQEIRKDATGTLPVPVRKTRTKRSNQAHHHPEDIVGQSSEGGEGTMP